MSHCFTYGSLMCEDIMSAVSGADPRFEAATLEGYVRHPVRGEAYPGIVAAPGRAVGGVLYLHLPAAAWSRLDRFEGDEYERREVELRLADGRRMQAWTYVFRAAYAHRLAEGEWDFARFLRSGKARFMAQFLGADGSGPVG